MRHLFKVAQSVRIYYFYVLCETREFIRAQLISAMTQPINPLAQTARIHVPHKDTLTHTHISVQHYSNTHTQR